MNQHSDDIVQIANAPKWLGPPQETDAIQHMLTLWITGERSDKDLEEFIATTRKQLYINSQGLSTNHQREFSPRSFLDQGLKSLVSEPKDVKAEIKRSIKNSNRNLVRLEKILDFARSITPFARSVTPEDEETQGHQEHQTKESTTNSRAIAATVVAHIRYNEISAGSTYCTGL